MAPDKLPEVDRRSESLESSIWWNKLSLAQKFSASSLSKFGYELVCIRTIDTEKIALLHCNGQVAAISDEGEIDSSSLLKLRK